VRTIRKFRIGPSLRIESRIGSSIRNRIESRSFAGPYANYMFTHSLPQTDSPEPMTTYRLDSHHNMHTDTLAAL